MNELDPGAPRLELAGRDRVDDDEKIVQPPRPGEAGIERSLEDGRAVRQ